MRLHNIPTLVKNGTRKKKQNTKYQLKIFVVHNQQCLKKYYKSKMLKVKY